MGERRVSIIIVPPGGARTVQCSISVVRIKLLAVVAGLTTLAMLGTSAVGVSLWDCATRGRALEIENDSLRVAIARMSDLDQRLSDLERAGGLRITVAAGVVACPDHGADAEQLLQKADAAMWRARALGQPVGVGQLRAAVQDR